LVKVKSQSFPNHFCS
jgi:hypothetical protein